MNTLVTFYYSNYICVLVHVCPSVQSRSTGGRQGPFNNSTWTIRGGVPLDDHKLSTTKMRKNEKKVVASDMYTHGYLSFTNGPPCRDLQPQTQQTGNCIQPAISPAGPGWWFHQTQATNEWEVGQGGPIVPTLASYLVWTWADLRRPSVASLLQIILSMKHRSNFA